MNFNFYAGFRFVGAVLACFCAASAFAGPGDIVPRGDATYDFLGSLAAQGRLPGYTLADFARGDRLYTRDEIARLLAANRERLDAIAPNGNGAAARRALYVLFALDLKRLGIVIYPNSAPPARVIEAGGSAKARLLTGPDQGTLTLRGAATAPIGRDAFFLIEAGNWRREWYRDMPSASTGAGNLTQRNYSELETALFHVTGRVFDVTVGRQPIRIGPGYSDPLFLSDESQAIPQVRLEKDFGFGGRFGRSLGRLQFTQIYGQFTEDDDQTAPFNARGTRRHLLVRRLETGGTGRGHLSISEAFKSTRLPDPYVPQIVPYYLYQNDWTRNSRTRILKFLITRDEPNTNWLNYMGDFSGSYRLDGRGTQVYADFYLDDIKSPFGLGRPNQVTPRKIAQQYGVYFPDLGGVNRFGLRLEYATSDRDTYTNISPPVAWDQRDVALGHAMGPNARTFFARADAKVSTKLNVALEAQLRRRGTTVADRAEPKIDRGGLYATYALQSDVFASLRLERQQVHYYDNRGGDQSDSRAEVNLGWGF